MAPSNPKKTPQTRPAAGPSDKDRRDAGPTTDKDRRDAGPTNPPVAPVKDRRDAAPTKETPPQPETIEPFKQRSIPELDLYLFNVGEHRRAHRLLGAHLVE